MQQNRPFIYNPSQKIEKSFAKASDGLDEGFQNIIDYKQKEYEFAKKQYEDVELLKKDLNIFDNEVITKRANELLGKASSMIKKDGKIDYNNAGEIRREIEAIRDAKRNSAIKAKVIEEANSLVFKNAADMTDVFSTVNQINGILRDPNKLFSPKDISAEVMDVYKKGINMQKRISDKIDDYLETRSGGMVNSWNSERGDVIQSEYKDIPGFTAAKGQYIPKEMTAQDGSKIDPWNALIQQVVSPEEMQLFAEQAGTANMFDKNPMNLLKPLFESKINSSVKSKVGMFAEDVARKESLTKATLKRIDLNDKKFELQKEALEIRRALADSTISKNSAHVAKLRDELNRRDAEGNREGVFFDESIGDYVYDETRDATKKSGDEFIKTLLGGDSIAQSQQSTQPKKTVVPAKQNTVQKKKTIAGWQ
jgi:hypothetical protein